MLKKYCPEEVVRYSSHNICDNYKDKSINSKVVILNKGDFSEYFNFFYGKYRYNNSENWYKLCPETLKDVLDNILISGTKKDGLLENLTKFLPESNIGSKVGKPTA